jgi:hypothetical protein
MATIRGRLRGGNWVFCVSACALLAACAEAPNQALGTPNPIEWRSCASSGACGATLRCETRLVQLEGMVDRFNIHDQSVNPLFPVDKFLFQATADHPPWEVWLDKVSPGDRQALFSKLRLAASTGKRVRIVARAVGVDAQLTGMCQRFLRFEVVTSDALKD